MENLNLENVLVNMPFHEVRLSVTGGCNHDCFYCGPFSDGKYSESKEFKKLHLTQIEELGRVLRPFDLHIQVTGGEPTLRQDLEQIFSILKSQGNYDLGLTTNCSMLDPERVGELISNGLSDLHIHVPTFERSQFEQTIQRDIGDVIKRIKESTLKAKSQGIRVEYNIPVTDVNFPTLEEVMGFCYDHSVNCKLIEVVTVDSKNIGLDQIKEKVSSWMNKKGIKGKERQKDGRWYGEIFDFSNEMFLRIAPTTPFLVDNLKGERTKRVFDGRYWIGGTGSREEYIFNSVYSDIPKQ